MSPTAPLTFSERVGLIILAETSAVSASSILGLLSYIAYSAVSIKRGAPRRWRIEGPAEVYFLNQLVWDLFQATGGLMNIKWAMDGSVRPGSICSAQGAVKQASDVGAAISTLIIAIYTIKTLCSSGTTHDDIDGQSAREITAHSRRHGLCLSLKIVAGVWIVVSLLFGINIAADGSYHFYGPTGLWCWIKPEYSVQRTVADFVFMWITAGFNIVIYTILFFYLRGHITIKGWRISLSDTVNEPIIVGPKKQAYGLLFYPLVYTVAILPLSIARYRTFAHHHVSNGGIIVVDIIYLSNGLFNVLLFSITRPFLLPHSLPSSDIELASPVAGPPGIEDLNDRTDNEAPAVRLESPVPDRYSWPEPADLVNSGILRWSPEGVAYVTNSQNPSTISVGV